MDGFPPGQFFTTSASLVDCVDKKLVVVLRDGRKLFGVLRSYDQFANLVLQDTVERIYAGNIYAQEPRGIYVIRGENVVLLGEVCLEIEDETPLRLTSMEEVLQAQKREREARLQRDKRRDRALHALGFSVDFAETDLY
ncbi:hypothetical protein THASP1DRAFT_29178 [Thamnocephalis sphaerospora]|uniref:U6 snRNA-associated Sm-like protein LSm1 n=1 Tax=Thamnocephalis sphaerospora TaxID=78915 RepID=A0A4P9XSD0_9FUNG|nr:hypothetical protein THASP1DRAFT_29178 [Thamnocephalis sphaerospora]|eukprot:RKP09027.1 hypothetical protein THASP1DRAFT_29178 [Thamnocephalis sphaerospora]